jgi:acyl-CoA synthetase (AMP-forming)/AMP-acid ligase II
MLSRGDATAALTAAGEPYELVDVQMHGLPRRVFRNAPGSLRDQWLATAEHGERPYFIYEDEVISYAEAHRRVNSLASWLKENGVGKGDRVAIGMRNYPEFALAFWAAECIGAIVVSLNAWWITEEMRYAFGDSGATVAIVDGERLERLPAAMRAECGIRLVVVARAGATDGAVPWAEVTSRTDAVMPDVAIDPDDDSTIFYTSGTTGFPKGAIGTHRNYVTNTWNARFGVALAARMAGSDAVPAGPPPSVSLSTFPFFHIAGLCGLINQTAFGGTIVSQFKWDAGEALRLIEKHRISQMGGVPTVVRSLLEHPDRGKHDISSLTSIGQGGAPPSPDTILRIGKDFAGKVSPGNGYGLTETTAGCIGIAGPAYLARPESSGLPVVGTDVIIADDDGNELPRGQVGEVWISGPNNVRGYWNKPEATAKAFVGKWFRSGDAGYMDDEGYIYVVDRIKDMVLRGGENVYCVEVESALFEHDAVRDCAVIGLPHEKLGEEVAAVIVPADGHGAHSEEDVLAHLKSRLAGFKVPSKVFWQTAELPRNATGKVLKKDLRDLYAG